MPSKGPRVLILGGLGMIGRTLVKYLVDYDLVSAIRVVDKKVPAIAFLGPDYKNYFVPADKNTSSNRFLVQKVWMEVVQGDLRKEPTVRAAFAPSNLASSDGSLAPFTVVVNLAADTEYGFPADKYEESIFQLRKLCAEIASEQRGIEKYVEVSTARVYECKNGVPVSENGKLKPRTPIAQQHLAAEKALQKIGCSKLPFLIVRLPIVYGPGDLRGLMPRIVCAAVYEHSKETMQFLWGQELSINTVHVQDVAAAIWFLVCVGKIGEVYNIVDENQTTQGTLNALLEQIFKIKTGFHGGVVSALAKTKLDKLVEDANEGHEHHWDALLQQFNISTTPLNPFLDKELLYNNPMCIDGSKLVQLGFKLSCPKITKDLLLNSIEYWKKQNLFPRS